jgi:hypothetical protein
MHRGCGLNYCLAASPGSPLGPACVMAGHRPKARRLAPATDTMSPVPPAMSPLPPATPTTVTATHVAMRADLYRSHCLRRLRYSRRDTPADRCKTGDSNDRARQDICEEVAATHCFHCASPMSENPIVTLRPGELSSISIRASWRRATAATKLRPSPFPEV